MRRKDLVLLLLLFLSDWVTGQTKHQNLEARVTLLQGITSPNGYPNVAIGISFINHYDHNIYIPRIINMIHHADGGLLKIYKKDSLGYRHLSLMPKFPSNPVYSEKEHNEAMNSLLLHSATKLTTPFNLKNGPIEKKLLSEIKKYTKENNVKLDTNLLVEHTDKPLFLKAHEERQYYITYPLTVIRDKPGEYKITFEPMLKERGEGFPEFIMGYRKYIPKTIESNSIFIHFAPIMK